ncbi:MAG: hypothetical protein ACYDEY_08310 [Acidimicrobiales bacterium]
MSNLLAMERDTALLAEQAGEATNAMVRWGLAAQAASDALERLQALVAARRQAELAIHQAVWSPLWARPGRHPWREIAPMVDIPWQRLYPRYRESPELLPRSSVSVD